MIGEAEASGPASVRPRDVLPLEHGGGVPVRHASAAGGGGALLVEAGTRALVAATY